MPARQRISRDVPGHLLVERAIQWDSHSQRIGPEFPQRVGEGFVVGELEKADLTNGSAAWKAFAKKLRRLIRDGIRLRKRVDFDRQRYGALIRRIDRRLMELAGRTYGDADADRLAKRLGRSCDSLFTFLDHPQAPFENNHAQWMIRPAVILRKNSQSNRSDKGAMTQAILMSIYRTLKLRGRDPVATVADALRTYTATAPPAPAAFRRASEGYVAGWIIDGDWLRPCRADRQGRPRPPRIVRLMAGWCARRGGRSVRCDARRT
jgi:transposase